MSPRYPLYPSQPNAGNLPCMKAMGPPDLRPSSSTAPYFKRKINAAHGRNLAGLGSTSMDMEPAYAYNELKVLDEMDDVQGNGIFDPYGAQKNIHPGAGVFATNYNLPGYQARERPYGFSEERDVTTGRPIRVVPGGAVANDSAAQIAFLEKGLYPRPSPMLSLAKDRTPFVQTADVMQNPVPVGNTETTRNKLSPGIIALLGASLVLISFELRKNKP